MLRVFFVMSVTWDLRGAVGEVRTLEVSPTPTEVTLYAYDPITPGPVVILRDLDGNVVIDEGLNVTWELIEGPGSLYGSPVPVSQMTSFGVANYTGAFTFTEPGDYILMFSHINITTQVYLTLQGDKLFGE